MRLVCEDLKAHVDELVAEWATVAGEVPQLDLPIDHQIGELPGLIIGLADAALCAPGDGAAHLAKVMAAAEHGRRRKESGSGSEGLILTEYHLMRTVIWRHLQRRYADDSSLAVAAIARLDTAITLATQASLLGFHHEVLEARGEWPGRLERLAAESPVLHAAPAA